jgi:hypothetical protein
LQRGPNRGLPPCFGRGAAGVGFRLPAASSPCSPRCHFGNMLRFFDITIEQHRNKTNAFLDVQLLVTFGASRSGSCACHHWPSVTGLIGSHRRAGRLVRTTPCTSIDVSQGPPRSPVGGRPPATSPGGSHLRDYRRHAPHAPPSSALASVYPTPGPTNADDSGSRWKRRGGAVYCPPGESRDGSKETGQARTAPCLRRHERDSQPG